MDTLTCMRTFVAVVDSESFTAGAARLDMSKAVASKYVAQLEDHLGTRLLNRTTRRLSLTESGAAYYERCVQILADVDEAGQAAGMLTAAPRGTLRVAMPVSYGTLRIAPVLTEYLRRYPEVRLDVALADRRVDLIEEGYDLAIRIGSLPESGLIARRLATDRIVLCASPAYLDAHGTPRTPADLKDHACLNYSYSSSGDEWSFDAGAVRVDGALRANNGDLLRLAALDGAGLIWQPHFIVGGDLQSGRLVEVMREQAAVELGIYAIYPSRKHLSAKVRTFVDYLARCLAEPGN